MTSTNELTANVEQFNATVLPNRAETGSQCVDWYAEGETRVVEVGGIQLRVRYVGRRGRRGRIAIEAPPGAVFRSI